MRAEPGAFSEASLNVIVAAIEADIREAQETGDLAWMESGFVELSKSFIARKLPLTSLQPLRDYLANIFPEFRAKIEKAAELEQWIYDNVPKDTIIIIDENLPTGTVLPLTQEEYLRYCEGESKIEKH